MKTKIQSHDFPLRFRKELTMSIRLIIVAGLAICAALWAMPGTARGDIFASINGNHQNGGVLSTNMLRMEPKAPSFPIWTGLGDWPLTAPAIFSWQPPLSMTPVIFREQFSKSPAA